MATASAAAIANLPFSPISYSKLSNTKIPQNQSFITLDFNFKLRKQNYRKSHVVKASAPGLYSADQFELTLENVDKVLDNVRPYLIADGGNVDVVSVENGVVSLQLQGACGNCPSSTTTMKMGIERVLKEKFGDAIKDICQVSDEQKTETNVEDAEMGYLLSRHAIYIIYLLSCCNFSPKLAAGIKAVNGHLDILRPAIKNFGGSVEVLSVVGGDCFVKYIGPDSIGSGIKAAIKEKFPDIVNVEFTN